MAITSNKAVQKDDSSILLICAIAITAFLFFLDEGNYSFHWITELGSWIMFIMYSVFIFIGEVFVSNILLKKYHSLKTTFLSVLTGSALGILFVIEVVMRYW